MLLDILPVLVVIVVLVSGTWLLRRSTGETSGDGVQPIRQYARDKGMILETVEREVPYADQHNEITLKFQEETGYCLVDPVLDGYEWELLMRWKAKAATPDGYLLREHGRSVGRRLDALIDRIGQRWGEDYLEIVCHRGRICAYWLEHRLEVCDEVYDCLRDIIDALKY